MSAACFSRSSLKRTIWASMKATSRNAGSTRGSVGGSTRGGKGHASEGVDRKEGVERVFEAQCLSMEAENEDSMYLDESGGCKFSPV